jgi:nucleotide sugar dehydrogenase
MTAEQTAGTTSSNTIGPGRTTIGVVGLGYVGLPLSVAFTDAGYDVIGFDIDADRIESLESGHSPVEDVSDTQLEAALETGFEPTDRSARLAACDVFVFAVPTGVSADGSPDMSALSAAVETAAAERPEDEVTLFTIGSTIYPGAVDDVVRPAIERGGIPAHMSHVAVAPERLSPGSGYGLGDIPVVVGADTGAALDMATALFRPVAADVHQVGSTQIAAMAKLIENTYRLVNISLVNDLATTADRLDVDIWAAIEAADTKPFGFQAFYPGVGIGGHCIPVDPEFLAWRTRQEGAVADVIETASDLNEEMPGHVVSRVLESLRAEGHEPSSASVLGVGLTYKPNVTDFRNSAAIDACNRLAEECGSVSAYDPIASDPPVEDAVEVLQDDPAYGGYDLVVLLVGHDDLDTDTLLASASSIFDTTNTLDDTHEAVRRFGGGAAPHPSHRRERVSGSQH